MKTSARKRAISLAYYRANADHINAARREARAIDVEAARAKERARRAANPEQARARDARYAQRNRDKVLAKNRRRRLRVYGLTPEAFASLLEKQGGRCAVCRALLDDGPRRHVDHDHKTGAVRGILCQPCNLLLGHAREDVQILARAIRYLGGKLC